MEQNAMAAVQARVSLFSHMLFAGALLVGVFVCGFLLGKSQGATTIQVAMPDKISVSLPDAVQVTGLPNEKVGCLDWVSDHMKDPTAGVISLVCNGKTGM